MTQLSDTPDRHKRTAKEISGQVLPGRIITGVRNLFRKVRSTRQSSRQHHTLSRLNDHQLRDIGLTRDDLRCESKRGFFDLTSGRYCDIGFWQTGLVRPGRPEIIRRPGD